MGSVASTVDTKITDTQANHKPITNKTQVGHKFDTFLDTYKK